MSGPYQPYEACAPMDVCTRAVQIRHLATLGLAATQSAMNIKDPAMCFLSMFEVITRLASEIEDEVSP